MLKVTRREWVCIILGTVFIATGIIFNEQLIEQRFTIDPSVSERVSIGLSPLMKNTIRGVEVILIVTGLFFIFLRKWIVRIFTLKNCILLLLGVALGGALLEVGSYISLRYILKAPVALARGDEVGDNTLYIFTRDSKILPAGIKKNFYQEMNTDFFRTTIKTNNVGMRENEDYRGEAIDVGIAGDSFAFGYGVNAEERFGDLLRTSFPNKHILSYGFLDGFTPPHYYIFLKNNPQYIPKTLIMTFYAENDMDLDIRDMRLRLDKQGEAQAAEFILREVRENGELGVTYEGRYVRKLRRFLDQFYTGKLIWFTWQQIVSKYNARTGTRYLIQPAFAAEKAPVAKTAPYQFSNNEKIALYYIEKLASLMEAHGARFLVLMIPSYSHVDARQQDQRWQPLKDWFMQKNIEFIDPFDTLVQAKDQGKEPYYGAGKDEHWTREGHRVVAESIRTYLEARP